VIADAGKVKGAMIEKNSAKVNAAMAAQYLKLIS
jgi:hypothetical protein